MKKKSNKYNFHLRVENEVVNYMKDRVKKESTTITDFINDAIKSALTKDADMNTISNIVGIKKCNNDKVTRLDGPVTFKKTRLKTKGMI
jgi:uncharacterized protein (UPF0335 family)